MSAAQQRTFDIAELAAALGSNVVPFVPPPKEEAPPSNSDWAASLDLIDHAAAFFRATEQRASQAEERAEKVATKAMEGLKSAQSRVEQAEAQARAIELHAAEEIKQAHGRAAEAEAWAQEAEERARQADARAREAESRLEAAEGRAKAAEEWLHRLNEALRQKLTFAAQNQAADEYLLRRSA